MAAFTAGRTGLAPEDIGAALAGRAALDDRAVVVGNRGGAGGGAGGSGPGGVGGGRGDRPGQRAGTGKVAFVFAGQGPQWPGMAADLLDASPVFAARMAECRRALAPHVDWDLEEVIRGTRRPWRRPMWCSRRCGR